LVVRTIHAQTIEAFPFQSKRIAIPVAHDRLVAGNNPLDRIVALALPP
jgi:hypothetical protein